MVEQQVKMCQLCPLSCNVPYGCTPVAGIGNINSNVVLVVPHPKLDNVLIESPIEFTYKFYLEKFLSRCGLSSEDYYITCVVKCPTESGNPKVAEIKQCTTFLLQEIKDKKLVIGCGEFVSKILKKNNIEHLPIPNLNQMFQSSKLKEEAIVKEIRSRIS